ncbi:putative protein transporter [Nosema bombycis CQ1]|uniref:Mitochondrial import inner membrane translocase subunit TIM14 n=1 Tax=Nosema bombycis (strain CQ1 / CVCC 102059) TaxID=578461 RepID=R0KXE7_NOSB1|nr:putative protein transporter [Nosema bombycis CQ1]|eukprot:EOB15576.1 putative protein transporter [Nosema bombycis CQ1]
MLPLYLNSFKSHITQFFTTPRTFSTPLYLREANSILKGPDTMERYKELMKINHPDVGGSKYLAERINEALERIKEEEE